MILSASSSSHPSLLSALPSRLPYLTRFFSTVYLPTIPTPYAAPRLYYVLNFQQAPTPSPIFVSISLRLTWISIISCIHLSSRTSTDQYRSALPIPSHRLTVHVDEDWALDQLRHHYLSLRTVPSTLPTSARVGNRTGQDCHIVHRHPATLFPAFAFWVHPSFLCQPVWSQHQPRNTNTIRNITHQVFLSSF
ncbi:hypothetical protein BDP81DRAFT_206159 [Colletotrichum phormii]|uniref:Uncharacterized protein n=1 Tax=Colletotrichum phormii TaxID=359342 RepID=A0AAJ0EGN6_9PEZI|nr:uncharacterized protein BDP81DRAFT_206159 [Colletotrichum phormii]KAK1638318.1 hypothetical protein BDP81DRAFT_206159 [Colletotrichum phormii]